MELGKEAKARAEPMTKARKLSAAIIKTDAEDKWPRCFNSELIWGFQCGIRSTRKCEAKANGKENGGGTSEAITDPTRTWGSSSMRYNYHIMSMSLLRVMGVVLVLILAVMLAEFRLWRRMRIDAPEEDIFGLSFWILVGGGLGTAVGGVIGVWSWGMFIGAAGAVWLYCQKRKWNFWEIWDEIVISIFGVGLVGGLITGMWTNAAVMAGGIILTLISGKTYRKFKWYKSGKPGFIGILGLIWMAFGETVVAFLNPHKLYWVGLTPNQWFSILVIVAGTMIIYLRSGLRVGSNLWLKIKNRKV